MEEIFFDSSSRIYRYLRADAVQELFDQHSFRLEDHHKILLRLAVLEEWLRVYHAPLAARSPIRKEPVAP